MLPPKYLIAPRDVYPADRSKSILIIDDDPFFRSLLKLMLAQAGLPLKAALEAEDSSTAVAVCSHAPVDLVFCDLNLNTRFSKNGIDTIRDLRKIRPELPIYMVTAENNAEVVEAELSAGATGHILKPVNLRMIRKVLISTFLPATP